MLSMNFELAISKRKDLRDCFSMWISKYEYYEMAFTNYTH